MYYVMQISSSPLISRHGYRCGNTSRSTFNLLICWLSLWAHFVCTSTIGILPSEFMLLSNGTATTAGRGCIPEGTSAGYQCTVVGDGVTVWQGSALVVTSCQAGSITLAHNRFTDPGGLTIACDGLTATTVTVVNETQYISRVIFNATRSLNGTTVYCSLNTVQSFGSDTIIVGVIPSAPVSLTVTFSVTEPSFNVSWSPPGDDVVGGLRGYQFIATSTGGDCGCQNETLSSSTTSVTCSGWEARGQTCSFTVRTLSLDCGFTSEPAVTNVTLKLPMAPLDFSVKPTYTFNGAIKYIDINFITHDAPFIPFGVSNNVTHTVRIESESLAFSGATCNSSNHCSLRVNRTQIPNNGGNLTVSALSSNVVGSSNSSNTVQVPSHTDDIIQVTIDVTTATATCHLLAFFPTTNNFQCAIRYGPSPNYCSLYTDSSELTNTSAGEAVTINITQTINSTTEYCYTVETQYGSLDIAFTGVFRSMCDPTELGSSPDGSGSVAVVNGDVQYTGVSPGSIATLSCDNGYQPEPGTENRTCMSDGNWSEQRQICIALPSGCTEVCVASIAAVVGSIFLLLILTCIIVFLYILKIYLCSKEKLKVSPDGNIQKAKQTETVSIVDEESVENTENKKANLQTDTYIDPVDLQPSHKSTGDPAHVADKSDNKRAGKTSVLTKADIVPEQTECAQYETVSLNPAPLVEPPRPDLYSEPFGALPTGKSVKVTAQKATTD